MPFTFGIEHGVIRLLLSPADRQNILDAYRSDAYGYITSPPGSSEWGTRLGDWCFAGLKRCVPTLAGKRVLEVGAGTLYIAERIVRDLGAETVIACDPSLRDESQLRNVRVDREYFNAERYHDEAIDIVVSLNVLEHVPDPFTHLNEVRQVLEPQKGWLYVVVPDNARMLHSGDIGVCVHEHLSYFTIETLTATLARCGMKVERIWAEQDKLFAWATPCGTTAPPTDTTGGSVELLRRFDSEWRTTLEATRRLINEFRVDRLAIHGCSVTLNNMLALLSLQREDNITLFDGDSRKVGKFLPAFERPIKAATDPEYRTMKNVIVAAMTFYAEIATFLETTHNIPAHCIHPIIQPA